METDSIKRHIGVLLVLAAMFTAGCNSTDESPPDQFDLYLLIGQSNMAGRATPDEVDKTPHKRVWTLDRDGNWVAAVDPIHFDKPARVGVGPGLSFGKTIADHDTDRVIGLIPAAAGGSPIASWKPGGFHKQTSSYPYDDAIARARIAMQKGTLRAVLWHQGEADSRSAENVSQYRQALAELAVRVRHDLDAPDVFFIVGELGGFLREERPESENINQILRDVTSFIPNSAFVSAHELTDKGDEVHFSSAAARTLGERYAEALIDLRNR